MSTQENYFKLSDEEFMNIPLPNEEENLNEHSEEDNEIDNQDNAENTESIETDDNQELEEDDESGDTTDDDEVLSTDTEEESEDSKETSKDESEIDYAAIYQEIFKPFKANGREYSVNSPQEVITLMQMGANYNKKMVALKPHLQTIKTLEKNGLLDNDKLNYLIDLNNKNPEAIKKLLKDSNFDTTEFDSEDDISYKPNNYSISSQEVEVDEVIRELETTPTFSKLTNVITNDWDQASRNVIFENPGLLRVINEQLDNGIFDVITKEVDRRKLFGQLGGKSDIEAYKEVGDEINSKGGFNFLFENNENEPDKKISKTNSENDKALNKRRKAASPTTGRTTNKQNPRTIDASKLSDEDFEKLFADKFI